MTSGLPNLNPLNSINHPSELYTVENVEAAAETTGLLFEAALEIAIAAENPLNIPYRDNMLRRVERIADVARDMDGW